MITKISRNYLEIKSIDELNYSKSPNNKCELLKINPPDFQINKFFYKQIGSDHRWIDRLVWDDQKWVSYVSNPNVKTYVLKENDDLVGYFEQIINQEKNDCEIAYFGILEEFFSKGYGGYLLSEAIKLGFQSNVKRVWVHTCSLDHPNAILNYKSRGMQVFKNEILKRQAI